MIIVRIPYRVSFFGGGTDYPAWYRVHGGAVLASTIDKYLYLTCRYLPPFFPHRYRIVWSRTELCRDIDEIEHPAVREVLRFTGVDRGLEIHYDGDLPARSGVGSSSSFTVGLLHAVHALHGRMPSARQLAEEAMHIEQDVLHETVGSQDQVLTAHGGFNQVIFHPNGEIALKPMTLPGDRVRELNDHLMLFYTGIRRTASDVARTYVGDMEARAQPLGRIRAMVDQAVDILAGGEDILRFGELLHEAWQLKRSLSDAVSTEEVDTIYAAARSAGAVGGKLLGAGGGGFMLLFVPPACQEAIHRRLAALIHVPIRFEFSGSRVIFHDPGEAYTSPGSRGT